MFSIAGYRRCLQKVAHTEVGGVWLTAAVLGTLLLYLPHLDGGFFFDDYPNFAANPAAQPAALDTAAWLDALLSGGAGPLGRPLAMMSFALNYSLGGLDPFYYKLCNLVLHLLCGLLCRHVALHLLRCLPHCSEATARHAAAATAALWLLHPMQLTVVLYTVQRMTSLSALFCLLGLWGYLSGRRRLVQGRPGAAWRMVTAFVLCTPLATLSKENGALLPLYLLLTELYFLRGAGLAAWPRRLLTGAFVCTVLLPTSAALVWLYTHWEALHLGAYRGYDYGPGDRLLTEARILWQYLHMLILPDSGWFGLHHDDIRASSGLWTPWTTLPATLGMAALLAGAGLLVKRAPIAGFGIAWFLAGHLMESTVLPLELAYEHRNYLPAFGPLLALCYYLLRPQSFPATLPLRRWALPALALLCALVTWPRAEAWGRGLPELALYELRHKPRSARIHTDLAAYYAHAYPPSGGAELEYYRRAADHLETCMDLAPRQPTCLGYRYYLAALYAQPVDPAWLQRTGVLLEHAYLGPADVSVLGWWIHACTQNCTAHDQRVEDYARRLDNNPHIVAYGRRNLHVAFADYYLRKRAHPRQAWLYMVRANAVSLPRREHFQTRAKLAAWLMEAGMAEAALEELDALALGYPLRTRTRSFLERHGRARAAADRIQTRYTETP